MHVFPTRDIHLVMAFPAAQIDLTWCADWPPNQPVQTWTDLATLATGGGSLVAARIPNQPANPAAVFSPTSAPPSPTGISFRPAAAGQAFYMLRATIGTSIVMVIVRVTTHDDVGALFLPTARIRMLPGRSDHVLTVFARFTDGNFADVSEHPYLRFSSDNLAVATVDAATGRVTAVAEGVANITVQTADGRHAQTCEVVVHDVATRALNGELLVRRMHDPAAARQTLWVVAEAYDDRARAERHAIEIAKQIFEDEANAPFRWLKDQFRVVRLWIRADRRGISVGPTMAPDAADPRFVFPQDSAANNPNVRTWLDPARGSPFGLMYGARMGGPQARTAVQADIAGPGPAQAAWLGNTVGRSVTVDHRRIGPVREITAAGVRVFDPRAQFAADFERLIRALGGGFSLGPRDRVAFHIDDQFRGGTRLSVVGVEPPENRFVSLTVGDPRGFDGAGAITLPPASPFMTRTPARDTFHARAVASSIVHEIGHSYGLGDEYESNAGTLPANDLNRHDLERYDNLQLLDDVLVGGDVSLERIKWHVHQVVKSSEVVDRRFVPGVLTVTLTEDARKWKRDEIVFLRTSFATPRDRDASGNVIPAMERVRAYRYIVLGTRAREVDLFSQDAGPSAADFDRLRVLYAPRRDAAGNPMTLIDPVVAAFLDTRQPFPRPTACNVPGTTTAVAPPPIPGVKMPTHREDLVGLYQGGHEIACGVVRPAGRCKMRAGANYVGNTFNGVWEFCFVCKFILVDRLDPAQLAKVQVHYPKDC